MEENIDLEAFGRQLHLKEGFRLSTDLADLGKPCVAVVMTPENIGRIGIQPDDGIPDEDIDDEYIPFEDCR